MSLRENAERALESIEPAINPRKPTPEPLPELPEVVQFDYEYLPAVIRDYVREALKKCRTVINLTKYRYLPLRSQPMKQITFADAEYSNKRKQTRKELFLKEME
ncbi:MAG: hypothetical protein JNL77_02665, partial [Nitrosomonas sp.]|nr:hypothetical protein [Nitrosomonas sp.]